MSPLKVNQANLHIVKVGRPCLGNCQARQARVLSGNREVLSEWRICDYDGETPILELRVHVRKISRPLMSPNGIAANNVSRAVPGDLHDGFCKLYTDGVLFNSVNMSLRPAG